MTTGSRIFWITLALALFLSRAAHVNILWADEDYHLAAAVQILHGKMLYREVWYDKPPLNALVLASFGAWPGWPLRIFSMALELATAAVAYLFASKAWGPRSGYVAATLYVFFQIFYFAHTVIPLEPDSLMMLPQFAAVYLAWRGRPFWAGMLSGIAFLLNVKGLFVLAACLFFTRMGMIPLLAGFAAPVVMMVVWLASQGAYHDYVEQVWHWGFLYAAHPLEDPFTERLRRFASWQVFHGALWVAAIFAWARAGSLGARIAWWLLLAFTAPALGFRFLPRYFDQIVPPLVILAPLGVLEAARRTGWRTAVLALALIVPVVRFGPRYIYLLDDNFNHRPYDWSDTAMDAESRAGAAVVQKIAKRGDTIFIWGYRPNVVAYTRLAIAGQLWDSQPVTMVPADRHLGDSMSLDPTWSNENQEKLVLTSPTIIVDGLSAYNPDLDIHNFSRLRKWFSRYCVAGTAGRGMTIYRICSEIEP